MKKRRRGLRRLLFWCAAAGCLVTVVAWVLSCFYQAAAWYSAPTVTLIASGDYGRLVIVVRTRSGRTTSVPAEVDGFNFGYRSRAPIDRGVIGATTNNYGFCLPLIDASDYPERVAVGIPGWIPVTFLGASMVLLWWLDRRRARPGLCTACGYDLTGNVSGTCPECGLEIASKTAPARTDGSRTHTPRRPPSR